MCVRLRLEPVSHAEFLLQLWHDIPSLCGSKALHGTCTGSAGDPESSVTWDSTCSPDVLSRESEQLD